MRHFSGGPCLYSGHVVALQEFLVFISAVATLEGGAVPRPALTEKGKGILFMYTAMMCNVHSIKETLKQ